MNSPLFRHFPFSNKPTSPVIDLTSLTNKNKNRSADETLNPIRNPNADKTYG